MELFASLMSVTTIPKFWKQMEPAEDVTSFNTRTSLVDSVFLIPAIKQPKYCCQQENVRTARRLTILMSKIESALSKTAPTQEKSG